MQNMYSHVTKPKTFPCPTCFDCAMTLCDVCQVMYAYVMRPETLPKSYWKFIVKTGPVEAPALEAVRRSIRKLPVDLQAFNAFIKRRGGRAFLGTPYPKQVGPDDTRDLTCAGTSVHAAQDFGIAVRWSQGFITLLQTKIVCSRGTCIGTVLWLQTSPADACGPCLCIVRGLPDN